MKGADEAALHSGQNGRQGQDGAGHWHRGRLIHADRFVGHSIDGASRVVYRRGHVTVLQHSSNVHAFHCRDVHLWFSMSANE